MQHILDSSLFMPLLLGALIFLIVTLVVLYLLDRRKAKKDDLQEWYEKIGRWDK